MYCIIQYSDPIKSENTIETVTAELTVEKSKLSEQNETSDVSSGKFKDISENTRSKSKTSENKELLINPNCYVQILLDYITDELQLNNKNFDFCDNQGHIVNIKSLKPYQYATELLKPQETYYIVILENDQGYTKIEPLLSKPSKLYSDISLKLKRQFSMSKKISPDNSKILRTIKSNRESIKSSTSTSSKSEIRKISSAQLLKQGTSKSFID